MIEQVITALTSKFHKDPDFTSHVGRLHAESQSRYVLYVLSLSNVDFVLTHLHMRLGMKITSSGTSYCGGCTLSFFCAQIMMLLLQTCLKIKIVETRNTCTKLSQCKLSYGLVI